MLFDSHQIPMSYYLRHWVQIFTVNETDKDNSSPQIRTSRTAILLLDIAGFTQLTDTFAQNGDRGAEQLSDLLNNCFTELLEIADKYGADVASFTGDGFFLVWDATEAEQAALVASAFHAISDCCWGEWNDHGLRLLELRRTACSASPRHAVPSDPSYELLVPGVVRDRHHVGGGSWLAEFRTLSVLCIRLLRSGFQPGLLGPLHASVVSIQLVAENLEGSILNVLMDDKGLSAWLAFGAPPFAHADNPLRAVAAALKIRDELTTSVLQPTIGVASGKLFCGDCGGRVRREYAVFGQPINMAARLIDLSDGEVVCDAATARHRWKGGSGGSAAAENQGASGTDRRLSSASDSSPSSC